MRKLEIQPSNRFGWLYSENDDSEQFWNTVLHNSNGAKIVPSLGSIVPGWVLTFPETPVLNLSLATLAERAAVLEASAFALQTVRKFGARIFHFEHGASVEKSIFGCGVDIAHLHTVPVNGDLIAAAKNLDIENVSWEVVSLSNDLWDKLGSDYLAIWEHGSAEVWVGYSANPTSQFFRKAIAQLVGEPDSWNYNRNSFSENITKTINAFSCDD